MHAATNTRRSCSFHTPEQQRPGTHTQMNTITPEAHAPNPHAHAAHTPPPTTRSHAHRHPRPNRTHPPRRTCPTRRHHPRPRDPRTRQTPAHRSRSTPPEARRAYATPRHPQKARANPPTRHKATPTPHRPGSPSFEDAQPKLYAPQSPPVLRYNHPTARGAATPLRSTR